MQRALILAAALTALTLTGAGCAAKNAAPPPQMKTSYPSPDYMPQTEQTPAPAPQAAPSSAPIERPLAAPAATAPAVSGAPQPMAGSPAMRPPRAQGRPGGPMLSRLFDVMDTDHNGRVTLEEWRAFQEREFRRLDKNDDGVLTREEMTAPPPMPGQGARPAP
jgi:hypothetical protein